MIGTNLERFVARTRVVLTAVVTWLVVLAAVITNVVDELQLAGASGTVLRILGNALGVIGVAVAIIRRVTPVLPEARGILDTGIPRTNLEAIGAARITDAIRQHPAGTGIEDYPGEFA